MEKDHMKELYSKMDSKDLFKLKQQLLNTITYLNYCINQFMPLSDVMELLNNNISGLKSQIEKINTVLARRRY